MEILPKTLNAKRIEGIKSDLLYTFTMRFYKKREADGLYVLDETIDMSSTEYDFLCKNFVFVRGRIVWVNFGFGIGNEFEGIKPALILGDAGPGELFILPMINEEGSDENPNYAVVEIDCSAPPVSGIAVINELRLISTNRIVTSRDSAAIDNETLLYVIARIAKFYANFYK